MRKPKNTRTARWGKTLVALLACIGILQGCYHNDYIEEMTGADEMENRCNSLHAFEAVAESDELWEFKEAAQALADKYDPLFRNLTDEEWEELEKHTDEAYIEQFFARIDATAERERVARAKEQLHKHTPFLQLSEEEQHELFALLCEPEYLGQAPKVKTRTEGDKDKEEECEKARQKAYRMAEEIYQRDIACGDYSININLATRQYKIRLRLADQEYEDCINNIKH